MEIINTKNLYCEKCSLQFDKKYVFDLHLSLKHGKKIQVKTEPEIYTEKSHEPQMNEKSFSDHIESEKSYNFETGNSKNEAKTRLNSKSDSHSGERCVSPQTSAITSYPSKIEHRWAHLALVSARTGGRQWQPMTVYETQWNQSIKLSD